MIKRIIGFFLVSVLILTSALPLSSGAAGKKVCDGEHNFELVSSNKATCTLPGYDKYKCSRCGERNYVITGNSLGHDFSVKDNRVLYSEATCTAGIKYFYSCSRCGLTDKDVSNYPNIQYYSSDVYYELPNTALGHGTPVKVFKDSAIRTRRTETQAATYYYSCSVCGAVLKDENAWFSGELSEKMTLAELYHGDIIQYGSYPQSQVKDDALLEQLETVDVPLQSYGFQDISDLAAPAADISYGDFTFGEHRYRKVVMNQSRPLNLSSQLHISSDKSGTYYFRFDPLYWQIVRKRDKGHVIALCINIVDFPDFATNETIQDLYSRRPWLFEEVAQSGVLFDENGNYTGALTAFRYGELGYDNRSNAENWLKNTFFNTAFNTNERSNLQNDNFYRSKAGYLPSAIMSGMKEKKTFVKEILMNDKSFKAPVSDYALCMRADYAATDTKGNGGIITLNGKSYAHWLLAGGYTTIEPDESVFEKYYSCVNYVQQEVQDNTVYSSYYGVRPFIVFKEDYIPEKFSTIGYSTIGSVQSTAGRLYDVNGDNVIDFADISKILGSIGKDVVAGENERVDINEDSVINISDVSEVMIDGRFGKTVG